MLIAVLCILSSCFAQSSYAQQVLFVTGDKPLSSADITVVSDLEALGMQVQLMLDSATAASDADGQDLVLISESALSTNVGNKFTGVGVPLVVYESHLYDDLGMSGDGRGSYGNAFYRKSISIQGTHALTGGFSGSVQVSTGRARMAWAKPGSDAIVAATLSGDSSRATIFGYEAGATLANGQRAPARRVGVFPHVGSIDGRTTAGRDLFLAAIQWALSESEAGVQVVSVEPVIEPITDVPAEPVDLPVVKEPLQKPASTPVMEDPISPDVQPTNESPTESGDKPSVDNPTNPVDTPSVEITAEQVSAPPDDSGSQPANQPLEEPTVVTEAPVEQITSQVPPVNELPNVAPEISDTSYQCDLVTESVAYTVGDTDFFTLSIDDESPLTLTYDADSSNEAVANISVDNNGVFEVTALSRGESYLWLVAEDENGLADEFELRIVVE